MSSSLFKNVIYKMCLEIMYLIYMYKKDLTGSLAGLVIPKTQKMVLDTSLPNTQHYKIQIKSKVEQSRGRSSTLPYTLV